MSSPHREWRIGTHLFRFEAPDLLRIEYHGALSLEEAMRVVRHRDTWMKTAAGWRWTRSDESRPVLVVDSRPARRGQGASL